MSKRISNISTSDRATGDLQHSSRVGFLDLPPELRMMTYRYILPPHRDTSWYVSGGHGTTKKGELTAGPHGRYLCDCDANRDACAMMLHTCRTVYEQLASLLYTYLVFEIGFLSTLIKVQSRLTPQVMASIRQLDLTMAYLPSDEEVEKDEKRMLNIIAQHMTGLIELNLTFRGRDISNHCGTSPPEWAPHTLRKLLLIKEDMPTLRKVFAFAKDGIWLMVRLMGEAPQAPRDPDTWVRETWVRPARDGSQEVELDVKAEYRKWLDKERERWCGEG